MNIHLQFVSFALCLFACITLVCGLPIEPSEPPIKSTIIDLKFALTTAKIVSIAVNNTFKTYCPWTNINRCHQLADYFRNKLVVPLPQLSLQDNITKNQTELLNMALVNSSTTLRKYAILIKNQVEIEHDRICAPAKIIAVPCHYPAACSKHISDSKAMSYCYLRFVESYLTDLNLLISLDSRDTKVDERLFLRKGASAFHRRISILVTLQTLLEHVTLTQRILQIYE
ncbi:uncharacterized protein LOC106876457 [Octopus bimaculoides]|uniref:Uncharacterized protein n=1 Tax=Octopus bimaculoides TaxID=37653 RepID=A0A0L8GJC3_OCTBM|nr:uncharacterized protein LOC106876457 [Octopus bimaculoides]|eukprot:XP_014780503.1 PREDICTED: uncharacterized protein LOC106876457 [Octopus bimaculoides]